MKWTLEIGVILIILVAVRAYTSRDLPEGPAPAFAGQLLSGETFALQAFAGKPALVHFWATWCSICRLEQDAIEAISKDHQVITVAMQSGSAQQVKDFLQEHGLTFPVYLDERGELASRYNVSGVPTTFILGPSGNIEFAEVGFTTGWGMRIRLWLAE